MNKYQDALEELSYPLDDSSCGGCKCGESDCHCKKRTAVETLQELVDKDIPKKPLEDIKLYYCPTCKSLLNYSEFKQSHCPCGQRLDWSDFND